MPQDRISDARRIAIATPLDLAIGRLEGALASMQSVSRNTEDLRGMGGDARALTAIVESALSRAQDLKAGLATVRSDAPNGRLNTKLTNATGFKEDASEKSGGFNVPAPDPKRHGEQAAKLRDGAKRVQAVIDSINFDIDIYSSLSTDPQNARTLGYEGMDGLYRCVSNWTKAAAIPARSAVATPISRNAYATGPKRKEAGDDERIGDRDPASFLPVYKD